MGSFNIGAGEIVGKCEKFWLYKLISIPFLIKIKKFKECIDNGNEIILETTIRPMTKRLYAVSYTHLFYLNKILLYRN